MKITIKDKEYALKLNYKVFRLLSEKWKLESVQAVFTAFSDIGGREIDAFVDLVECALKAVTKDKIDVDDVGNWIFENPDSMSKLTKMLTDSLPKSDPEDTEGKQIAEQTPQA